MVVSPRTSLRLTKCTSARALRYVHFGLCTSVRALRLMDASATELCRQAQDMRRRTRREFVGVRAGQHCRQHSHTHQPGACSANPDDRRKVSRGAGRQTDSSPSNKKRPRLAAGSLDARGETRCVAISDDDGPRGRPRREARWRLAPAPRCRSRRPSSGSLPSPGGYRRRRTTGTRRCPHC